MTESTPELPAFFFGRGEDKKISKKKLLSFVRNYSKSFYAGEVVTMLTLQYHGGLKTKIDNKNGIYFFNLTGYTDIMSELFQKKLFFPRLCDELEIFVRISQLLILTSFFLSVQLTTFKIPNVTKDCLEVAGTQTRKEKAGRSRRRICCSYPEQIFHADWLTVQQNLIGKDPGEAAP